MNDQGYDAIVVGAGLAGIACAAELVLHGKRPLLIAETEEVAHTLRSGWVGRNRGLMQTLFIGVNRYWFNLARQLDIPLRLHPGGSLGVQVRGRGGATVLPYCPTAAGLTEVIEEGFGFPTEASREGFRQLMYTGMVMPWDELVEMATVSLAEWLAQERADQAAAGLFLAFAGTLACLSPEETAQHMSVFGAFQNFRTYFGHEGTIVICEPDIREGLAIPLANEIESRGGHIWRGCKVDQVQVGNGTAIGVRMQDGRVATAPNVAIATGNARISKILHPIPEDAIPALEYSAQFGAQEFTVWALLNEPVVPEQLGRCWLGYFSETGDTIQYSWPLHKMAPWSTEPGKQLVVSERLYRSADEVRRAGGDAAVFDDMLSVNETLYAGFRDALEDYTTMRHRHLWMSPLSAGPKLPRRSQTAGLWFVGDGSTPIHDLYTEGAASAGILGARAIAHALG